MLQLPSSILLLQVLGRWENNLELYYMILILRGHIRAAFDENNLYNITAQLVRKHPIEIYIHTWNIQSVSRSWRHIPQDHTPVTEERIRTYFKDLSHLIKHIIIDDEEQVELIGKTEGGCAVSCAPLKGWKYMWYGQHRIADYLHSFPDLREKPVVSMRFDIFSNVLNFDGDQVLAFFKQVADTAYRHFEHGTKIQKNIFPRDGWAKFVIGCDNIYGGTIATNYQLTKIFVHKLDRIYEINPESGNQEFLAVMVNNLLWLIDV